MENQVNINNSVVSMENKVNINNSEQLIPVSMLSVDLSKSNFLVYNH